MAPELPYSKQRHNANFPPICYFLAMRVSFSSVYSSPLYLELLKNTISAEGTSKREFEEVQLSLVQQ